MLEVIGLGCERGERVLFANVSFALSPGDTLQIKGSNGTGKTTLLSLIAGLSHTDQGDIFWEGRPLRSQYALFCFNSYFLGHRTGLKPELTPVENLLRRHQLSGRASAMTVYDALIQVGLETAADQFCYQLSAGQQRRVALAGLLMSRAPLWILDEPFTAIDSSGVLWFENLMHAHSQAQGMTLFTSHQPLLTPIKNLKVLSLEAYGYEMHRRMSE